MSFILQAAIVCAISLVCWRLLRLLVASSELDNIPGPPSDSWLKGNFLKVFDTKGWEYHRYLSETYGGVIKIHSLFGDKQLYVFDPKALYHIIVKDQAIYEETTQFIEGNQLMFGKGLFATLGDHHRKQRKLLNPVFSANHMRDMIPIFAKINRTLRDTLKSKLESGPQEIDMLKWMTRTALELIGQSGLGYSFDPLVDDSDNHPYSKSIKNLVPALSGILVLRLLLPFLVKLGPPKFRAFLVRITPSRRVQRIREMIDTMEKTSIEILDIKKEAIDAGDHILMDQIGQGKDLMSILLKANMIASEEDRLQDDELIAQMSTLIFAAMDTTSSALARTIHLLALHPEVQDKLRKEIQDAHAGQEILEFDDLVSLPYLDAVCRETLRLYPPVPMLPRVVRKDIVMPLSKPIVGVDGRKIVEILIPKDTNIIISILASNRDPEIWGPDSYDWKPERWLSPLPDTVAEAHIPGIYSNLTFLGGGRACIGFKFSQLEMKSVLSMLLQTFVFAPSEKEIYWNMTGVASPSVGTGTDKKLEMPLKMSLVTASA